MADNVDDIMAVLAKDDAARAQVIKALARDYSDEFLEPVQVNTEQLDELSRGFLVSAKEWQE